MDRMWKFAKRHRGKLIVAGVVSAVSAGGLYLVTIYRDGTKLRR